MNEPNPKLMDLIFLALDHGIESVKGGGSLIPFTITEGEERKLNRFADEQLEVALANAQHSIGSDQSDFNFYAIAHDGYITVEGIKYDSILVEGGEKGTPSALLFAQRYEPKKGVFKKFKTIGNAAFVGEAENRIK